MVPNAADAGDGEYLMLGPAQWSRWEQRQLIDPQMRILRWNVLPQKPERDAITDLRILIASGDPDEVPSRVSELQNLRKIEIPQRLVTGLTEHSLPSAVRTLVINGTGKTKWPRTVVLPSLEALLSIGGGKLDFDTRNFPSLKRLTLSLDEHGKRLGLISDYSELVELNVMNVSSEEIFVTVRSKHLQYLGISGGKLASIKAIGQLAELEHLTLGILPRLTSLEGVQRLERLRVLRVAYCSNLSDISPVLSLKSLRQFELVGCKKANVSHVWTELSAMKLDRLDIITSGGQE